MMANILPFYVPETFRYSVKEISENNIVLYAELKTAKECDEWIAEFSNLSSTRWIVRRTKPESTRLLCRKDYVCHHTSFRKKPSVKRISKNLECEATISIVIKLTTAVTKRRHQHIKDNLPAVVTINNTHSHSLDAPDATGALRASTDTRKQFEVYFQDGFGITRAINFHVSRLELELEATELAKSTVNPKYRTVRYWYETWRELNPGPLPEIDVLEKLKQKQEEYKKLGITIRIEEHPFAIVIVTPLMKRAHQLPTATDIVYVHSTATCDADHSSITFLFTTSVAGAVPLAIIVTKTQTLADHTFAFQLWKSILRETALEAPKVFMTDDNDAEIKALQAVFPKAKLFLSSFHIGRDVWKWLWDKDHGILEYDRLTLYHSFKSILTAPSIPAAESAFHAAIADAAANKYPQWLSHIAELWIRRKTWCVCYHDDVSNHFTETGIRLYEDIVIRRCKPYSVVALVDFTSVVMERYWIRQLQNFAYGHPEKHLPFLKTHMEKASYLSQDMITRNGEYWYIVPSENQLELYYDVDIQCGCCSCEMGKVGNWCKHQTAVYSFLFDTNLVMSAEDRYNTAVLALGDRVDRKEFFPPTTTNSGISKHENIQDLHEYDAGLSQDSSSSHHDVTDTESVDTDSLKFDKDEDTFLKVLKMMKTKHQSFGTSQIISKRCFGRLRKVRSRASWDAFLRSFGSNVVPRRKPRTVTEVKPVRSGVAARTQPNKPEIPDQIQPASVPKKRAASNKSRRVPKDSLNQSESNTIKKRQRAVGRKKGTDMGYHFIFLSQIKDKKSKDK